VAERSAYVVVAGPEVLLSQLALNERVDYTNFPVLPEALRSMDWGCTLQIPNQRLR